MIDLITYIYYNKCHGKSQKKCIVINLIKIYKLVVLTALVVLMLNSLNGSKSIDFNVAVSIKLDILRQM